MKRVGEGVVAVSFASRAPRVVDASSPTGLGKRDADRAELGRWCIGLRSRERLGGAGSVGPTGARARKTRVTLLTRWLPAKLQVRPSSVFSWGGGALAGLRTREQPTGVGPSGATSQLSPVCDARSFSLTAAGQLRILTGFPFQLDGSSTSAVTTLGLRGAGRQGRSCRLGDLVPRHEEILRDGAFRQRELLGLTSGPALGTPGHLEVDDTCPAQDLDLRPSEQIGDAGEDRRKAKVVTGLLIQSLAGVRDAEVSSAFTPRDQGQGADGAVDVSPSLGRHTSD